MQERPIACDLTVFTPEERTDHARDAEILLEGTLEETADRLIFRYPRAPGVVAKLARFVEGDQQCCAFMTFEISSSPAGIVLTLAAPPEAKPMLLEGLAVLRQGNRGPEAVRAWAEQPSVRS